MKREEQDGGWRMVKSRTERIVNSGVGRTTMSRIGRDGG